MSVFLLLLMRNVMLGEEVYPQGKSEEFIAETRDQILRDASRDFSKEPAFEFDPEAGFQIRLIVYVALGKSVVFRITTDDQSNHWLYFARFNKEEKEIELRGRIHLEDGSFETFLRMVEEPEVVAPLRNLPPIVVSYIEPMDGTRHVLSVKSGEQISHTYLVTPDSLSKIPEKDFVESVRESLGLKGKIEKPDFTRYIAFYRHFFTKAGLVVEGD